MSRISIRFAILLTLLVLMAGPGLALHSGPPSDDNGDGSGDPTWRAGCTCHSSSPSSSTLVKLSGAPHAYEVGQSYTMILTLEHSSNAGGGFFLSTEGMGTLSWLEDQIIRPEKDSGEDESATSTTSGITQSDYTSPAEWTFDWAAPESDLGDVTFWIIGNMVNNDGAPIPMTTGIRFPSSLILPARHQPRLTKAPESSLLETTVCSTKKLMKRRSK